MLVTFECKAYANITYFGDVAKQLIKMMGHSGSIPSAILADDVPKTLVRLQQALAQQATAKPAAGKSDQEDDREASIEIATRALPLVELLNAAIKDQCDVMWR
ncbi:MAG: DUF1840 domain-containing protein [Methyloglobulus sp.]|nr:DUF1840 domain-containing protein [Methyloglobulus sp.]